MLDLFKQISFKYLSSYFREHLFAYKKTTVLLQVVLTYPSKKEFICLLVVNNFPKQAGFLSTLMSFHWNVQNSLGTLLFSGENVMSKQDCSQLCP